MSTDNSREMDPSEVSEFLAPNGTGVLSLAAANVPYSIPVSYGYDPEERSFYFRLGFHNESEKRNFVSESELARLVVYGQTADGWKSVIVVGELERIGDDELTINVATNLQKADLPLMNIWNEPADDIEFLLYRLDAERLSGRREVGGNT